MKPGGKPKEGQQSEKGPKKLRLGIGKMVKIGSGEGLGKKEKREMVNENNKITTDKGALVGCTTL